MRLLPPALILVALSLTQTTTASGAIIGGKPTPIEQVPWSVALAYDSTRYGGTGHQRFLCGGTLVAPTVVLTAAHCVHKTPFPKLGFDQAGHIEAITGRARLSDTSGLALPVTEVHYLARHGGRPAFVRGGRPLFDKRRAHYDVALLRLAAPALTSPIQLAGPGEGRTWRAGRTGLVSGWGYTTPRRATVSDRLVATRMRRVRDGRCARETTTWRRSIKLCANGAGKLRATCRGDSGGPFAVPVRTAAGPTYRLVGITNYGTNTFPATGCGRGATTFARVAAPTLRRLIGRTVRRLAGVDAVGSGARPRR